MFDECCVIFIAFYAEFLIPHYFHRGNYLGRFTSLGSKTLKPNNFPRKLMHHFTLIEGVDV